MNCKDCEHFKIINDPFGYEWGQAKCTKYGYTTDFRHHGSLKILTCPDKSCAKCKFYRRLKHNFKVWNGYEENHCCVIFANEDNGWIQEVAPNDRCEMYEVKNGEEMR